MIPPADSDLARLRALLEDVPGWQVETAAGTGSNRDFYFANPPALQTPALVVALNGVVLATPADYVVSTERDRVTLTTAPPAGSMVAMKYARQTFNDDELLGFLSEAAVDWPAGVGRTYRAAAFALDTLLMGVATALNFGAGAETFDVAGVHERLERVRAQFAAELSRQAARPAVLAPVEPVPLLP